MQSSPFASYPLGSIPPQASSSYLPQQQQQQQQYGRSPSGYPQPNYGVGPGGAPLGMSQQQLSQQAMMMHQQQQQLAAQGMGLGGLGGLGMGGPGGSVGNLHPTQIAQLQSQFLASQLAAQQQQHSQHQQQQGHHQQPQQGGGGYGNHPMYAQQQYQQQQQQLQQHQQQQQQQQHHSQHSSSKDQREGGDHHRSSRSSRKSKGAERTSNPAVFNVSVESEVEPIGDDLDGVTERSLAIERYKLNHDLLGELFNPVPISKLPEPQSLPSLYTISDLETRLAALEESNSSLASELASQRKEAKEGFERARSTVM
ncbi:hypothetical protein BDY24DRAFT_274794 [Mrakia frigida]|uniref:uncharacterized protein n=1 Tax=Mrakia frigida TaxID=29902 RepID=UPI003FCC0986